MKTKKSGTGDPKFKYSGWKKNAHAGLQVQTIDQTDRKQNRTYIILDRPTTI